MLLVDILAQFCVLFVRVTECKLSSRLAPYLEDFRVLRQAVISEGKTFPEKVTFQEQSYLCFFIFNRSNQANKLFLTF